MKRPLNLAFFSGTVVIAFMAIAAFSNIALSGGCSMQQKKTSVIQNEQIEEKKPEEKNNEA